MPNRSPGLAITNTSLMVKINLVINGDSVTRDAEGQQPLAWLLREELKLTKTKLGCGLGQCGACTVLLDGQPIRSCITPLATITGQSVTTIEGLTAKSAVMTAWRELSVPRCHYCHVGQLMAATALLDCHPHPDDGQINAAMSRQFCQCGADPRVLKAIDRAAEILMAG